MRRQWLLVGLLLAGCTSEPSAPAPWVTPGAEPGVTLAYREVYRSTETDVAVQAKLRNAVLQSDAELSAYLLAVWGSDQAPLRTHFQLDFAQETGIVLAAGSQPDMGALLRLTRLTEANGRLEVRFSVYGTLGPARAAHPFRYVAIARPTLPVDVQTDQPCQPPADQPFQPCR